MDARHHNFPAMTGLLGVTVRASYLAAWLLPGILPGRALAASVRGIVTLTG